MFEHDADFTHSGAMLGSGELAEQGQGKHRLLRTNSYTSGVVIAQGSQQGTTDSLQGSIVSATALVVG